MVSAPLPNLPGDCLLWQVDADELWSAAQIIKTRELFRAHPEKTAAWFWCHYFVGPDLAIGKRNCYGNHPGYEWQRVWRYRTGMSWASHEPPRLVQKDSSGADRDVGTINPFLHYEMEKGGLVFQHFAYVLPRQLEFKETYYGYQGALREWKKLQLARDRPLLLKNYFSWVRDEATAHSPAALSISPIARFDPETGACRFSAQAEIKAHRPDLAKVLPGMMLEGPRFHLAQARKRLAADLKRAHRFFARIAASFSRYFSPWHLKSLLTLIFVDGLLLSFVRRRPGNAVFVLKLDRLGDYILCRKFLRLLRTYPPYQSRKIILGADISLKELIETYDADAFDGLIWIDPKKLMNEARYRFAILRQIRQLGATTAIHPTYAREAYVGDCLIRATGAAERVGRESYQKVKRDEAARADFFYTRLLPEDPGVVFDFYRYQSFFSALLPGLEMPRDTRLRAVPVTGPEIAGPFAVIMPGANQAFREWPPDRFAEVARALHSVHGFRIVILGTPADHAKGDAMQQAAPETPMENLCGELSLPQIVDLISRCALGITNESGGIHVLAALDKPGIAVANGNRFGWFYPYPRELSASVSFVYPPDFHQQPLDWKQRKELYRDSKFHSLREISAEAVLERVSEVLQGAPIHDPIEET